MIAAVIPTRFAPPPLATLLDVLAADGVRTMLWQSEDFDHRIYAMWNAGTRWARGLGATEIAILNDDITIQPGTLPLLAKALRSEPDLAVVYPDVNGRLPMPTEITVQRTEGSWSRGGMTGFCFMFRAELPLPEFDEGYHWWYGDDAFEEGVRAAGYGVGRVVGVPIAHSPDGSAHRVWDELAPLIAQDRARWEDAHP